MSLNATHENLPVIRNMLLLLVIMLKTKTRQALEQLAEFDVVTMLVKILNENKELSYLALACISLLIEAEKT